jgi:23S rRNA-/tRNA-specific pseudouridylate synthase
MDGDYPATVQKLLMYWYPPPSLSTSDDLLKTVSEMTSPPKDNELRHCHQLDYATSGVLLFARNKAAATAAMQAFASRKVHKVYLAMVRGHVEIDKEWPVLPKERLKVLEEQETMYRQRKAKKREDTFAGFLPSHSMFQKWQAHYLKQQDREKDSKRLKQDKAVVDLDQLWKQSIGDQVLRTDELQQLANSTWKEVKGNPRWKQLMERLSKLYNDATRHQVESTTHSESTMLDLPKLFRIEGEPDNAFYIFAPLAEVDSDFAMRVQPGTLPKNLTAFDGTPDLDYKPALTRCVILNPNDARNGPPLTKVQLEPKTGRRHQLRVHMLINDTSIVGDATYEDGKVKGMYPRMCLHAHSLSLPVLNDKDLSVTAPDPFTVNEL